MTYCSIRKVTHSKALVKRTRKQTQVLNLRLLATPFGQALRALALTCNDLCLLQSRSNLHASRRKFFTVWSPNPGQRKLSDVHLRWLNTVFNTCVSFTFFSKTLDPSVAKNGSKQVDNTNVGFLMVKLTYVPLPWQHE